MTAPSSERTPREAIEALLRRPAVRQALAWIGDNLERFVEELTTLTQIAAPTFAEGPRGKQVARRLREIGLEQIHTDAAGNVIGSLGSNRPGGGVVVMAHLDTVFRQETDVTVSRRDGRLHGPGTGDNAAGVAGVLMMLDAMRIAGIQPQRPLWIVASTGEEGLGDLRGARAVMQELGERDVCVVAVEGALLGRVTHQAVGSRRWQVHFSGPGGHSWHDFGRPSAINAAALAVADLSRTAVPSDPRTTFNVGRIDGGMGVNVIAAAASFLIDMRSTRTEALDELAQQAEAVIRRAAKAEGVTVRIETVGERPAGAIAREHQLVQTAAAVLRHFGIAPRHDAASTDANIPLSLGVPAITIGITHGGGIHTESEWIEIEPAVAGVQQLLLLTAMLTSYRSSDNVSGLG